MKVIFCILSKGQRGTWRQIGDAKKPPGQVGTAAAAGVRWMQLEQAAASVRWMQPTSNFKLNPA